MVTARDERSVVRGKKGHEVGYLFSRAQTPGGMEHGYLRLSLRGKVCFQQGRGDETGAHSVDTDSLRSVLEGGGLRQAHNPMLGRDVGRRVLYADATQHR